MNLHRKYSILIILIAFALTACADVPEDRMSHIPVEGGQASPLLRQPGSEFTDEHEIEPRYFDLPSLLAFVDDSPSIAAARENIARETGAVIQGSLIPNPVIRLEADYMPIDDLGFGNSRNTVTVSQQIETMGKPESRVSFALAKRDEAEAIYYHQRLLLIAEVSKTFYKAVFTRSKAESTSILYSLKADLLSKVNDMNAIGRLSDQDLITFEIAVHRTKADLINYEAEERTLLRQIEGQLGLIAGTILGCRGSTIEYVLPDPEDARNSLLSYNSTLIMIDRKLETARMNLIAQERLAYPDLTVGLGLSHGSEGDEHERDNFINAYLEIPFPLIDRNQGAIQSSEAEVRQVEAEIIAASYQMLDEWHGLYEQHQIIVDQLDIYRFRIIPLLENELSFMSRNVELGRKPIQSQLNASINLEEANIVTHDLEEALAENIVEMMYLLGQVIF